MSDDEVDAGEYRTAGIIKEIKLVNFQSHRHFRQQFGPCVNFIIGKNGSGKSSIIQGLCVALCATGKQTGRTSKLDDLINTEANFASVTVILKNEGMEAYNHEVYGNEIRIKRELVRGKGSTYKIQTSAGRNVKLERGISTKKELDRILDHFNIQQDNPCIMMTQDASREFLRDSNAKTKFLFFEKATLLYSMRTHNENSVERHDEMAQSLEDGHRTYADTQAKLNELENRYHRAESYTKKEEDRAYNYRYLDI